MSSTADHLDQLRNELKAQQVAVFLLPLADAHQGEAIADCDLRLRFITGFTGSAGYLVVSETEARLFVDGRYTVQAKQQVDQEVFSLGAYGPEDPLLWAAERVPTGGQLGFDPQLHSLEAYDKIRGLAEVHGFKLSPLKANPVDRIWHDRPAAPCGAIFEHAIEYAGETREDKIARVRQSLEETGADVLLLNRLESIAWLLNLRGKDVAFTPVAQGFIALDQESVKLFVDTRKINAKFRQKLAEIVTVEGLENWGKTLDRLSDSNQKVLLDVKEGNAGIYLQLARGTCQVIKGTDPILAMQAVKNQAEIQGMRAVHLRDGQIMCKFLRWLEEAYRTEALDEAGAAAKLNALRAADERFVDFSFSTISAFGANGALPHYRFPDEGSAALVPGSLYLVDSGGQYRDGTTDITRTVVLGEASAEQKRHYTLVLKGMIALSRATFPEGVRGHQLDALARQFLWQAGLDYNHGTGHGVGAFLGVHEGPNNISPRPSTAILPGMIQSNEPGIYFEGHYGIRIENLILAKIEREASSSELGEQPALLGFETLTFTPLDRKLIDKKALAKDEITWINAYHEDVKEKLSEGLDETCLTWLIEATKPL